MIPTASFVRNSCIGYRMDNKGVEQYDLSRFCKELVSKFVLIGKKLNSMTRQPSAQKAWASIKRFYDNCKNSSINKKGVEVE